jgi:hypothetical protein
MGGGVGGKWSISDILQVFKILGKENSNNNIVSECWVRERRGVQRQSQRNGEYLK